MRLIICICMSEVCWKAPIVTLQGPKPKPAKGSILPLEMIILEGLVCRKHVSITLEFHSNCISRLLCQCHIGFVKSRQKILHPCKHRWSWQLIHLGLASTRKTSSVCEKQFLLCSSIKCLSLTEKELMMSNLLLFRCRIVNMQQKVKD